MSAGSPRRLDEEPVADNGTPRYELPGWMGDLGLVAGVTAADRQMDFRLGPDAASDGTLDRWARLLSDVGNGFPTGVVARQVHGSRVRTWAGELAPGLVVEDGLDGHATSASGVLLSVTVADCVPVYLAHRDSAAIALLHAGWRGVASGVLEAGVERLLAIGGGTGQSIVMHCGISICGSCYEVGPEVFEALGMPRPPGPTLLELRSELARRARELGVGTVSVSGWCTAHDRGRFHSHRASAGTAGRMAAYLGRAPA